MAPDTVCRREGHDWQPTEVADTEICSQCQTLRTITATGKLYRARTRR